VGRDLIEEGASGAAIPVVLENAEKASGLADMLHQFIEQTLDESEQKRSQARGLSGEAVFRAAEDENVCVHIAFCGDRIELRDGGAPGASGTAAITADFLTIAHLTSGQESPFALLARHKLRARFRLQQLPFLLNMLRFMRSADRAGGTARARWLWLAAAVGIGAAALCWFIIA
jgi:hypothetical protein